MNCEVRLFARARDLAGAAAVVVQLPPGATVGELRRRLGEAYPALQRLLPHSVFAVNDEFAADMLVVPASAAVAMLPPVSGG